LVAFPITHSANLLVVVTIATVWTKRLAASLVV